ncbi:MAG: transcription antitermination factor NusB [bacterium]|nr:transcription antitermination factor NusB [bacterium]MDZ4248303.1 transcription antitermination factor NusB [Patescibacteria group bacterium]
MANRHVLRTILMQSLYEQEFHPKTSLGEIAERYLKREQVSDEEHVYIEHAATGLAKHRKDIDKLIVKHAPEWPLDQIASIDRAVLRLGIYEVLHSDEVPPKVAINEAVELAKAFGGENSGSFVNGVLGTVYRSSDRYDGKDEGKDSGKEDTDDAAKAKTKPKTKTPTDRQKK